eukprot:1187857-Prorocentrum_minimum.AAC.6
MSTTALSWTSSVLPEGETTRRTSMNTSNVKIAISLTSSILQTSDTTWINNHHASIVLIGRSSGLLPGAGGQVTSRLWSVIAQHCSTYSTYEIMAPFFAA